MRRKKRKEKSPPLLKKSTHFFISRGLPGKRKRVVLYLSSDSVVADTEKRWRTTLLLPCCYTRK